MALVSPGVEVTIIDQSAYLPGPLNSIPLIILATAQNKADPTSTAVAAGTTAANAGKLYLVTSQRDLVTLYGNPFFYTTSNGTPIQGYELNEYGLLAAYSALGVTNLVYTIRADIDLASLVGSTGRPVGFPAAGTWWLDATNSTWGIYEFDAVTGQFVPQSPIVITDPTLISGDVPIASVGNIGQYAVIAIPVDGSMTPPDANAAGQFFFKNGLNEWVRVGSTLWVAANPTVQGTNANPALTPYDTFILGWQGTPFTITVPASPNNNVAGVSNAINALGITGLYSYVVNGRLTLYTTQVQNPNSMTPQGITITADTGTVLSDLGIVPTSMSMPAYYQPQAFTGPSSQQPLWQEGQQYPAPTGSVWIKVGSAGSGLAPVISQWDNLNLVWQPKTVGFATSDWTAISQVDSTGGQSIPAGTVYAQYGYDGQQSSGYQATPVYYWERIATGPTVVVGSTTTPTFTSGPYTSEVQVSVPGSASLSSNYILSVPDNATPTQFVTQWAAAGIPFTVASVTSTGAIQLQHTEGGVIVVNDIKADGTDNGLMTAAGFSPGGAPGVKYGPAVIESQQPAQTSTTGDGLGLQINTTVTFGQYYVDPTSFVSGGTGYAAGDKVTFSGTQFGGTSPGNDLVVTVGSVDGITGAATSIYYYSGVAPNAFTVQLSNWVSFDMTASAGAPVQAPANLTNWFYSVVDQVDIMVNTTNGWKGYSNVNYNSSGFPLPNGTNMTDPNGPIVSASIPTTQSDGSALVYGDLWVSTSDLDVYPVISRWELVNGTATWVAIDNTDHVSSNGIVFADARWGTSGAVNPVEDPIPTIQSLLKSNYYDLDAPDSVLYPVGMLLFNTRRSGFNVKQFRTAYFNLARFPDAGEYDAMDPTNTDNLPEFTYTWVSASGLDAKGVAYMGSFAQREMIVKALRSVVETNQDIRNENNSFNLMACPSYPELQPDMVTLNDDRGQTAFIIGDTPMKLPNNATALQAWATNAAGAEATGPAGLVTRDSYLGVFYPSGIAPDLSGNLVAVPPSHMMIRTFLRNDTIAYPWFAAAGTTRGTIDNATNIGYVDSQTGEFIVTSPNQGNRDVLYTNQINPLVFFVGQGLLCYGNKSSKATNTALDRINVARLICYIRVQLNIAARPFLFEPNDALTRQQISGVIQSLFVDLVAKRGIYDYLVVCDTSNNTPARIDRNELWVDCAIEPVKAVEFIYIPVRILNTGALGNNNG